jgi:membrane protein implicated in regulation of membrane protease activity
MAILLALLLIIAGLFVGAVALENTTATTLTVAGQDLSGLSLGGWLLAFTVLGFLSAYLVLGMLAAARRGRMRRRALRSSEREMAERVAQLERENLALRDETVTHGTDGMGRTAPADTLVDTPAGHGELPRRHERVERDEQGRRLAPPADAHPAVPDSSDHVRDHPLARDADSHDGDGVKQPDRTRDRV